MELPRIFTIREQSHRVINPIDPPKLELLGRVIRIGSDTTVLDLACGKGELLCTWARAHAIRGTGVDVHPPFLAAARDRAKELDVTDRVRWVHADASEHVAEEPVDVAACIGATWIGDGPIGTLRLLDRSLRPGGLALVGEPFWRKDPPDEAAVLGSHAQRKEDFLPLPELVEAFGAEGWDTVEMVCADQDSFDRYVAAQWLNLRTWLDAHPDDELAPEVRAELTTAPAQYTRYQREYLGWGVFALMKR